MLKSEPLPPTSLIIATRNRPMLLRDTIESILNGEDIPAELIVIDQSDARDTAVELLARRGCAVRHERMAGRGVSRARNRGIALAMHDVLAFTDDDLLAAPAWYGALVRALLQNGPRVVATGRVVAAPQSGRVTLGLRERTEPAVYDGRLGIDVLAGGNMAIRRSALEEVGDFDERLGPGGTFPAAEDNDLGYRLLEAGYRIVYVPDALLHHRAWRRRGEYVRMRWDYGRGQGAYYAKHSALGDMYMLGRMGRQIGRNFYKTVIRARREPRRALGQLAFIAGLIYGYGNWVRRH